MVNGETFMPSKRKEKEGGGLVTSFESHTGRT